MICRPDHFSWRRVFELSFIVATMASTSLLAEGNMPQALGAGDSIPEYMSKMMGKDGKAKPMSAEGEVLAKAAAKAQLKVIDRNPHDPKQALKEIAELAVGQCDNLQKYYPSSMTKADVKECQSYTAAQAMTSDKMDQSTANYTVKIIKIGLLVQTGQKTQKEADQEIAQIFSGAAFGN